MEILRNSGSSGNNSRVLDDGVGLGVVGVGSNTMTSPGKMRSSYSRKSPDYEAVEEAEEHFPVEAEGEDEMAAISHKVAQMSVNYHSQRSSGRSVPQSPGRSSIPGTPTRGEGHKGGKMNLESFDSMSVTGAGVGTPGTPTRSSRQSPMSSSQLRRSYDRNPASAPTDSESDPNTNHKHNNQNTSNGNISTEDGGMSDLDAIDQRIQVLSAYLDKAR